MLFKPLNQNSDTVRDFLARLQKDLAADQFSRQHPFRLVGFVPRVEKPPPDRQEADQFVDQLINAVTIERRHRHVGIQFEKIVVGFDQRQYILFRCAVNLVDDQDNRNIFPLGLFDDPAFQVTRKGAP